MLKNGSLGGYVNYSKLKNLSGFLSILTLASCSSMYQSPESFEEKMSRFQARSLSLNTVPHFQVAQVNMNASRSPASVQEVDPNFENQASRFSNRHLYFMALYSQYIDLKAYSSYESLSKLNSCPAFHTSFITQNHQAHNHKRTYSPDLYFSPEDITDPNVIAFYPELQLPLSKEELRPTVADYFSKKTETYKDSPDQFHDDLAQIVNQALEVHISKTYHELVELCEYGQSDNYYVYENLITYITRNPAFGASSESMKTLLRTTLFSNKVLTKSLLSQSKVVSSNASRSIASVQDNELSTSHVLEMEVAKRTKSDWTQDYISSVINHRSSME